MPKAPTERTGLGVMGMFDDITCRAPLPDGNQQTQFQTKDLQCALDHYTITEDGCLLVDLYELRSKENWKGFGDGSPFKRANERTVEVDPPFHGRIRFYGGGLDDWREYEAKFTDGRLEAIALAQERSDGAAA